MCSGYSNINGLNQLNSVSFLIFFINKVQGQANYSTLHKPTFLIIDYRIDYVNSMGDPESPKVSTHHLYKIKSISPSYTITHYVQANSCLVSRSNWPFKYPKPKSPIFECFHVVFVQISDPHCIVVKICLSYSNFFFLFCYDFLTANVLQ